MNSNMFVYNFFVGLCIYMDIHVLLSMSDDDWIMLSEVAHDNIREEIQVNALTYKIHVTYLY